MLGLQRGTVRLVPHDPRWKHAFTDQQGAICARTRLSPARVQHAGSTSVPDLVAKPILDIVVGATDLESVDDLAGQIVDLGYLDRGWGEGSNGRLLVLESAPEVRTVHLHIVLYESEHWRHYVAFRDALRSDPALLKQYGDLKRDLAKRFHDARKSYTSGKEAFILTALSVSGEPMSHGIECRDERRSP